MSRAMSVEYSDLAHKSTAFWRSCGLRVELFIVLRIS